MKHPVWDRILILLCALVALGCAAGVVALLVGKISFDMITGWIAAVDMSKFVVKAAMVGIAALFVLLFLLLFAMILPSRKKRSSNYAIQRNENGMVRISLKALETLVNKCLNQHAELKVVTSSLYSDEESIRVDVHISLQSDISMPLAISALQKQIKKYLEACSGVMVQEVRVFVDSTIPADEKTEASPYAIPTALLGLDADPLPVGKPEKQGEPENQPEEQPEEQQDAEAECGAEPEADEPETKADDTAEEAAQEDEQQTAEQEQGEQA